MTTETTFAASDLIALATATVGLERGWPKRLVELVGGKYTDIQALQVAARLLNDDGIDRPLRGPIAASLAALASMGGRGTATGGAVATTTAPAVVVPEETDEEALTRIQERFRVMGKLVGRTLEGKLRSLIISGPGGVGKSHPTKAALREAGVTYVEVTGTMSAVGLYKALWAVKDGGVLLLDDADSVFDNIEALNLLKAALDSSKHRVISWLKESRWMEEEGIDSQFEFNGQVIFISNIDFEGEVDKGHKRAPHLEALLSRSHYLDLDINTSRDLLLRIEDMVCSKGMLDQKGMTAEDCQNIVGFMKQHASKFRSLTLREASKLADLVNADRDDWRAMALATLSKRSR